MTEFKIPELGENVATGDVTKVLVNVGDTITREQPVLELETDKATIEVPSSVAAASKEIRVKKGDKVKVGAVVLTVDALASGNGDRAAAAKTPPPDAARSLDAPPAAAPPSAPATHTRAALARCASGGCAAVCPRSRSSLIVVEGRPDARAALRLCSGQADAGTCARACSRATSASQTRWPGGAGVASR